METRNKLYLALFITTVIAVHLFIKGLESSQGVEPQISNQEILKAQQVDEYTPFVRPQQNLKSQNIKKEETKSKIKRFRQKLAQNSTTLTQTRAHEFHNPNSKGLTTEKKKSVAPTPNTKKVPQTEEEIKKAQEQAKEQARIQELMKTECGDIKNNEEKAECHQAVANYVAEQKAEEAKKKAENNSGQSDSTPSENADNNETQTENEKHDEEDSGEDSEEQAPSVIVTPQPTDETPTTSNDNDSKRKTLAEWRSYLEETASGETMQKKALVLHAATNKSGKDGISEADFITLIREYYLDSNEAELEKSGMQALDKTASIARFRHSIYFLSKEQVASSAEEVAQLRSNFRFFYLRDDRLTALNIYLNSLPYTVVAEDTGESIEDESADLSSTASSWGPRDPLFVTIELINEYASTKLSEVRAATTDEPVNTSSIESSINSLKNDLTTIVNDNAAPNEVKESSQQALVNITSLLEQIKPDLEENNQEVSTQPTTTFGFNRR